MPLQKQVLCALRSFRDQDHDDDECPSVANNNININNNINKNINNIMRQCVLRPHFLP